MRSRLRSLKLRQKGQTTIIMYYNFDVGNWLELRLLVNGLKMATIVSC